MSVTPFFIEAAKAGNKRRVRDMMADSLIRDPLFEEFDEMLRKAGEFFLNPYEPYDGKPFNQDKAAWDKLYLDNLMGDLRSNFSQERVKHVKEVCRFIYKDRIETIVAERRRMREEIESKRAAQNAYQQPRYSEQIYGGSTVGSAPASNSTQTNAGSSMVDEAALIQHLSELAQGWYLAMMNIRKCIEDNGFNKSDFKARLYGKLRKDFLEKGVAERYVNYVINNTREIVEERYNRWP